MTTNVTEAINLTHKNPSISVNAFGNSIALTIHPDTKSMREEVRRAMKRIAAAAFADSGWSAAIMACSAEIKGNTIAFLTEAHQHGRMLIQSAFTASSDLIGRHNGLSASAGFCAPDDFRELINKE